MTFGEIIATIILKGIMLKKEGGKMKTILKELYDGNIYPAELIALKNDPKYDSVGERMSDMLKMWEKKLSEDDFNQLEALLDVVYESCSLESSESFVYGFRLGALIMIEVMTVKEGLVLSSD